MTCIYNPNTKLLTIQILDENGNPITQLKTDNIDINKIMEKVVRGIR